MSVKHDLIFFEKRSTPKVVSQGKPFTAPESYGKQTKRRPATADEEKQIANGDWVRVDEKGKKGGEEGYKKTRMKGREHLVQSNIDEEDVDMIVDAALEHHGVKGMHWGTRTATSVAKNSKLNANNRAIAKAEKASTRKILPTPKRSGNKIAELKASNERINSGKLKVKDILDVHSTVKVKDILAAVREQDI